MRNAKLIAQQRAELASREKEVEAGLAEFGKDAVASGTIDPKTGARLSSGKKLLARLRTAIKDSRRQNEKLVRKRLAISDELEKDNDHLRKIQSQLSASKESLQLIRSNIARANKSQQRKDEQRAAEAKTPPPVAATAATVDETATTMPTRPPTEMASPTPEPPTPAVAQATEASPPLASRPPMVAVPATEANNDKKLWLIGGGAAAAVALGLVPLMALRRRETTLYFDFDGGGDAEAQRAIRLYPGDVQRLIASNDPKSLDASPSLRVTAFGRVLIEAPAEGKGKVAVDDKHLAPTSKTSLRTGSRVQALVPDVGRSAFFLCRVTSKVKFGKG